MVQILLNMVSLPKESNSINAERFPVMVGRLSSNYAYSGQFRQVKQQIVDMALNGSGVRDTARVLNVSPSTVIRELKKSTSTATSKLVSIKQLKSRIGLSLS